MVFEFSRRFLIRAGTRKGRTENQMTTMVIKRQIMTFSHLRGSRERGVVRPIVTVSARMTNFVRPVMSQKRCGTKERTPLNLAIAIMMIRSRGQR